MASKITTSLQALELSDKLLVGKMPPGKAGVPDKVKVNAYRMELTAKQPFYKYDVNIVLTISKEPENIEVSIVQGKKNDSQLRRVKNEAVRIFEYAQKNNRGFFKGLLFYNCMAVLITTEKLNIAPGETKSFPYPLQEFNLDKNKVLEVKLQVKCVKDEFEINPQIEPTAQVNKRLVDLRLLEALNQVVQHVSYNSDQFIKYKNNVIYLLDHEHYGFTNQDAPAIRNRDDLYMGIGQNGAVKTLGGSGGHRLYFVTDVCKSLFHRDYDSLIDKVKTIAGQRWNPNLQKDTAFAREILSNIKGLEVCRQYGKWLNNLDGSGRFVIDHLGECANNVHFEKDGKITTMTAYYKQEYNITLKYPSLFTISPKNKRDVFFPVELLLVAPDQRATMSQIPATVQGDMVRASAVKPFLRERQILNLNRATGVLSPNISAGIKIARDMEMASARILQEPRKLTNNKELVLNPKREIDFTKNRYHKPASVPTMGFYVFGDRLNNFNGEVYKERLITIAKRNGMTFKNVPKAILHRNRPSDAELEKFFQDVRKNGIMFLFLVVQDDYNLHNTIKRLEQKYQVLTQEVRLSKALKSQPQTEQNVIHKMNVKNGGLNYTVKELVDRNLLIIGFTTSRSSAIDKVGVVGYSYNGSSDPCAFIGGYKFVERGEKDKEIFSPVMEEVIKKAIGQVLRSRKTKVDKMIVYINGLSDGLLHDINELYNKKIRAAMGNETIKFSTIAVSRSHVERFFKDNKGKIDNVLPGTVIDDTVVSPVFTEFYLNAHIAIQGTAKTPKYILMTDYIKQSLDKIQELTYALCCLHQIIYTNTALPAPVLIADRYATRGSTNYVSGRTPNDVRTVEQLNQELTYDTRPMDLIRFNA